MSSNLKLFDKIALNTEANRAIYFASNESEIIKGSRFNSCLTAHLVSFKLKLKPINNNFIEVYFLPSEENNICIPSIFKGIQDFVEKLDSEKIIIKGFRLEISNCIIHPVDFKPRYYETYTNFALQRLSFYKGIKLVKQNETKFPRIETRSFHDFIHKSNEYPTENSNYMIKKIHLPCRGLNSISLLGNYNLEKKIEDDFIDFKIFLNHSEAKDNYITIYTLNDIKSFNIFNSVIEEILMYKSDIYSQNKDLSGFDIFIGRSNFKYKPNGLGKYLYWSLLALTEERITT